MNTHQDIPARIEPEDIGTLLAIAAAADTRFPALSSATDPRLGAWSEILGETRLVDAHEAVMRIVRRPQLQVMQPGHVLDEVKLIRKERLRAIGEDVLVPPEGLEPGRYPAWLRVVRGHVADSVPLEEALAMADEVERVRAEELDGPRVSRRMLGPSVSRAVVGDLPRGMSSARTATRGGA